MEESLPILSCMQGSYKGIPYSQNSLKKAQYLQMSNEKIPWLFRAYRGWKPYPVIIGTIISHDIRIPIKNQPGWLMESIRFSVFFFVAQMRQPHPGLAPLRPCARLVPSASTRPFSLRHRSFGGWPVDPGWNLLLTFFGGHENLPSFVYIDIYICI